MTRWQKEFLGAFFSNWSFIRRQTVESKTDFFCADAANDQENISHI